MLDKLIELLKEKHGEDLDLQNQVYYLFFKDGLFSVYLEDDTKTLKVAVELLPENNTFVYQTRESIEDYVE